MIRWTLRLNEFNIEIEHRPIVANKVGDSLSSTPRSEEKDENVIECALFTSMDIHSREHLIEKQRKDPELSKIIKVLKDPDSMTPDELRVWGKQSGALPSWVVVKLSHK